MRKLVVGVNDFQSNAKDLMKEWDWNKNEIRPDSFTVGHNYRAWWICSACGHEWQAYTSNRLPGKRKNTGCPKCAEKKRLETHQKKMEVSSQNLLSQHPELAAEWHPYKNKDLPYTPTNVSAKSQYKVWWLGKCGHEWQAAISSRSYGCGCPVCKGDRISKTHQQKIVTDGTTLAAKFPNIAAEWHPTKNFDIPYTPLSISAGSPVKVWWLGKCSHEWQAQVNSRTGQKTGCPICSRKKALETRLSNNEKSGNSLAAKFPNIAAEWHPTKNSDIPYTTSNVAPGSKTKAWWLGKCGHEWQAAVDARTKKHTGCPYCAGRKFPENLASNRDEGDASFEANADTNEIDLTEQSNESLLKKNQEISTEVALDLPKKKEIVPKKKEETEPKKKQVSYNTLEEKFPDLAAEWHPTKNGELTPRMVAPRSSQSVWWQCKKGHEWKTRVASRTQKKHATGCPLCLEEKRTSFPEFAVYFYIKQMAEDAIHTYFLQKTLELDVYIPSIKVGIEYDGMFYHKKTTKRDLKKNQICKEKGIRLYRLREGLETLNDYSVDISFKPKDLDEAIANLLTMIFGTAISVNTDRDFIEINELREISEKENSLAYCYPELIPEWNQVKNGKLTPYNIARGSAKKVWWKCKLGHDYRANIPHRIAGTGCPYCANNEVLSGFNDLQTLYPNLAAEWHPDKNGELKPKEIVAFTPKKVWWLGKCGHEWQARVNSRVHTNASCPVCCNRVIVPGINDLVTWCNENGRQDLIDDWDYEHNGELSPLDVSFGSNYVAWWKCHICNNTWKIPVTDRTGYKQSGCPYCGNKKIIPGFNDLLTKEPELCKEWNYERNTDVSPREISYSSGRKVWWKCRNNHEWQATVDNRRSKGRGCPFCKNFKAWPGYNDLKSQYPEVAKEWDYAKNDPHVPEEYPYGSNKKAWWKCSSCGHEWQTMITVRTLRGYGCPECRKSHRKVKSKDNKGES